MGFLSGKLRAKPERKLSEPIYETPEAYNRATQVPSIYGPHFQKGPQQAEIYDRRANGESIPLGHPDLRDRAHSFHQPRQHHAYSDPFVKRPKQWPNQMDAEHKKYHIAGDLKDPQALQNEIDVQTAARLRVGSRYKFEPANGQKIKAGIAATQSIAVRENLVFQGRDGFAHKYPQPYENENALMNHDEEVKRRRNAAKKQRVVETELKSKYSTWAKHPQNK